VSGAVWGIVLAAGSGSRFGGQKQFAEVHGERLVDLAIDTTAQVCDEVVLVLPPGYQWDGRPVAAVAAGGSSRSASVRAGLALVSHDAAIIVTHDPAHPLATASLMRDVVAAVRSGADAALPAVSLAEPLKRVRDGRVVATVLRDGIVSVQGPHAFRASALRSAHADEPDALEDTQLIEHLGGSVAVVRGDPRNIHVTEPDELEMVARLLSPSR
jgi:2-C-methyl-D-erythritol 4-phosphate cytidylyltransferase